MKNPTRESKPSTRKYLKPVVRKHKSVVVVSGSRCSWSRSGYNSDSGSYFH